jgi:hypothetical protein
MWISKDPLLLLRGKLFFAFLFPRIVEKKGFSLYKWGGGPEEAENINC